MRRGSRDQPVSPSAPIDRARRRARTAFWLSLAHQIQDLQYLGAPSRLVAHGRAATRPATLEATVR